MTRIVLFVCAAALAGCAHPPERAGAPLARARFYAGREEDKPAAASRCEKRILHTAEGDVVLWITRIP